MLGSCREIFFGVGFFREWQGGGLCVLEGAVVFALLRTFKVLPHAPNW